MKELIAGKHKEAEDTLFMKTVFAGKMTEELWADYTYNKTIWYKAIEDKAKTEGILNNLVGIERFEKLLEDYRLSKKYPNSPNVKESSIQYHYYIMGLETDKVVAHLYTWYMGDLSGGAMIKRIIKSPNSSLDFDNPEELKKNIMLKINEKHIDEVNIAFDWAIKIMKEYDKDLTNG
jgi:heme oxygenase